MQCASFEFADKSVVQSLRVSLFDEVAGMVADAKVGDTIFLSRLRVKRYGAEGYAGYVGHGGSASIIPAGSKEWIDPVPREGLLVLVVALCSAVLCLLWLVVCVGVVMWIVVGTEVAGSRLVM